MAKSKFTDPQKPTDQTDDDLEKLHQELEAPAGKPKISVVKISADVADRARDAVWHMMARPEYRTLTLREFVETAIENEAQRQESALKTKFKPRGGELRPGRKAGS